MTAGSRPEGPLPAAVSGCPGLDSARRTSLPTYRPVTSRVPQIRSDDVWTTSFLWSGQSSGRGRRGPRAAEAGNPRRGGHGAARQRGPEAGTAEGPAQSSAATKPRSGEPSSAGTEQRGNAGPKRGTVE